jgi:hypothetical protein
MSRSADGMSPFDAGNRSSVESGEPAAVSQGESVRAVARARAAPGWIAAVLLVGMAALAVATIRHESVTLDEVPHIGAGLGSLQQCQIRLNLEQPPLAKVIAAAPLVISGVRPNYDSLAWKKATAFVNREWVFGRLVLSPWSRNARSVVFLARLPMIGLTVLLGWVLYWMGRQLGGEWGGVLPLAVYATAPVFLAYGPLVLTDLAVTLFVLLFAWALADVWQKPSRGTATRFGLVLAGALLSKFSAGLLFVVLFAFWFWSDLRPIEPGDVLEKKRIDGCLAGVLLAGAIVYLVYMILTWRQPVGTLMGQSRLFENPRLARLLAPVVAYGQGLVLVLKQSSRPCYFFGRIYRHGIVPYFPVLFLLKMTPGFLGLLALGGVLWLRCRKGARAALGAPKLAHHRRALVTTFIVFAAACIFGRLDISIRHFYVPIVLLILSLAYVPALLGQLSGSARKAWRAAVVALALASVASCLLAYPNYVPYLNFLARPWPKYVVTGDSNLDWNQALPVVEKFVEKHRIGEFDLDAFGVSDPHPYVPGARLWNCQDPPGAGSGWAVLSSDMILEFHNCAWLLAYPHEFLAGGSMLAVRFPASLPARGEAGGPPPESERRHMFPDLPHMRELVQSLADREAN